MDDELALLEPNHPGAGEYNQADNGVFPPFPGDTSKAWAAANWLADRGMNKDSLAWGFATWGRVELASRLRGEDEHGADWINYIPELVDGHYLTEITARTMFRPADILPAEKLSLQTLCDASIYFAARQFVLNDMFNRRDAMDTVRACAVAAIHAPEPAPDMYGDKKLGINPELADVIEFYLEDGNLKADWEVYNKMDLDGIKQYAGMLIGAAEDKLGGKPGAAEQARLARRYVDGLRTPPHMPMALAAYVTPADAYKAQKEEEESTSWASASFPADFVRRLGPASHGPWFSPREAADIWENAAKNELSGDWFEHYTSQSEALRAHTSPNAIDKAGDIFSASADAAKTLLDGLTEFTAYQRTMVIYRPPAVPLPYTWQPAAAAAK
jgi:hypothetical protein